MGRCWSTRADAPWNQPDWEIWSLAWDPLPVTTRIFELHQNFRMFLGSQEEGDHHVAGLRMAKVPVFMLDPQRDIPMSTGYPLQYVADLIGRTAKGTPYLESSIAYMMGLAMLEFERQQRFGGMKIGIWGVDLHCESEYAYQRPNLEYLIGMARGMGIKVFIPPQSALLTHQMGKPYGFWSATEAGAPSTPLPESAV